LSILSLSNFLFYFQALCSESMKKLTFATSKDSK
jgi:hypothetical protein